MRPSPPTTRQQILHWMLGDRHRKWLALTLFALLLALGAHFGQRLDELSLSYDEARQQPEIARGRDVLVTFSVVRRVEEGRFFVSHYRRLVEVVGHLPEVAVGRIVSVRGRLQGDLRLVMSEGYVHTGRGLKWILGAVTLLGVLGLAARESWLVYRYWNLKRRTDNQQADNQHA